MEKYHITPSGQARSCSAQQGRCKYGKNGVDPEHYSTKEDAQKAYEEQQEAQQSSTKSIKKTNHDKDVSNDEAIREEAEHAQRAQQLEHYKLQGKKYSYLFEESLKQPSLSNLTELREIAENMVSTLKPFKNFNKSTEDAYITTLESTHEALQREKIALQKNHKKLSKASLGSLLSAKAKEAQEAKIAASEQNINTNANSIESLEQEYESFKYKIQKNRLEYLSRKGYPVVKRYSGLSMSLHPQGPKVGFVCPSCDSRDDTRVYKNKSVKNTGYIVNCSHCSKGVILPVTKVGISTLEE